jgi:23S rRNA pseudouridine1911/1915/1917 synthase
VKEERTIGGMRTQAESDGTVFEILTRLFPGASKTTIRKMLRNKRVTLERRVVSRADTPVKAGQAIEVVSGKEAIIQPPGRLLHRDAYLLAAEKPAGILSMAAGPGETDTFYRRMNEFVRATSGGRERIYIVHRLDREASGIMLFALTPQVQEKLQRYWNTTEKRYWTLVEGAPPQEKGTIRSYLRESSVHRVYSAPEGPDTKLAITHYRLRRSGGGRSLLEVRIETGRKNQIRVQLADLGCPIVGDRKYGARTDPIHRLGLHAFLLIFNHPVNGERIRLRLPIPGAFRVA